MENQRILVSGAGIAGPALAHWLHRYGFQVTVVERAPGPRPGGQAVDIRGVAHEVVRQMGLTEAIRAARVHELGMATVTASGKVTSRMPADAFGGEGFVAAVEILRGDLSQILYAATRSTVDYRFGDSIAALAQDAAGVDVRFESGATGRFDLVVAADGSHSRTRALAFGPEERCATALGAYVGYFSTPVPPPLPGWFAMHNIPGGRMAAIRPGHPGTATAMVAFRADGYTVDRRDVAQQKRLVAEVFGGDGWLLPQILRGLPDAGDFYLDSLTQVRLDSWSQGRVVLVGDAGYSPSPLTGLGTCLSLVGAYVLAGELAAAGGDHRVAFARYDELLRPYVKQCQELPPGGVNGFLPAGRGMIAMRAASMRAMTKWPMRALMARAFAKADAIELPSYAVPAAK